MADEGLHVGDIGTVIELDTGADISTATVVKIKYRKRNGETGEWVAEKSTIAGTVSGVRYTTQSGDLDQAGLWSFRAYVDMPDWSGHGAVVREEVFEI